MVLGEHPRAAAWAAAAVLLLAPTAVACGDDGGGGTGTSTPTPGAASPGTESPGTPTGTARPPAESARPGDPDEARRQVAENWKKFFDPAVPLDRKAELLENGDDMRPVLEAFSGDERGGKVQANVSKVEFTSATEAQVTYDLMLDGRTALPNSAGTAVLQDDTWKVSAKSLCALVKMSGNVSVPGC
ncbi:hypothetical protein ACSNOD_22460 [Streptomyces sp. URMC 123]